MIVMGEAMDSANEEWTESTREEKKAAAGGRENRVHDEAHHA